MKKKLFLVVTLVMMCIIAFGVTASAETEGIYRYTVSDGQATITDCDESASGDIIIPDTLGGYPVTQIGMGAFKYCTGMKSVTIPSSVTQIGSDAFYYCAGLTRVNITDIEVWCNIEFANIYTNPIYYARNLYLNGELVTNLVIPDGVTAINNYAFYYCTNLTSVVIPDSVTKIGDNAFFCCESLVNVTIPDSVTKIGSYAFENCISLASMNIPDSVTEIGLFAFNDCTDLVSVSIGSGVEVIPFCAFDFCSNLKAVVIPASVKCIESSAFYVCSNIAVVFYEGSQSQWNEILFNDRNENLTNGNVIYNAVKKTYKFVTNCDNTLPDITDYAVITMPTVTKDGMTFAGWYDNATLSGNAITFPYYGDATTLYAAWSDRTGVSFDKAFIAKANQEYKVTTTSNDQLVYFEFVPKRSKTYYFYTTGSNDTYGVLYDSSKSRISSNDDSGDGINFRISYSLTAGETYYIAANIYFGTGSFDFVIEDPIDYRINWINVNDMTGAAVGVIPTGESVATVSVTNVSSSEDTMIVLAKYNQAGDFCGVMYKKIEGAYKGANFRLSIPVDNTEGDVAKLKAFCWESFGSMIPMGDSVSFPAE